MIRKLRTFAVPAMIGLIVGLSWLLVQQWQQGNLSNPFVGSRSYATAVNRAAPAVVNIYTTVVSRRTPDDPLFNRFMEAPRRERLLASLGSGVIVSRLGYLLTSNHVVEGADEIFVSLADGREATARVVGTDPETDLALLRISLENLPYMDLTDEQAVRVGDVVLAIGNPLGVGQTVSMGIVSATGRSHLGIATFENFIQTDAAINQGNSGGALIDTRGNLVGINTAILTSDGSWQGIGFSTPVSVAREVMNDLIEHGRVIRGWLGVTVQDITPSLATTFGLLEARGGLVSEVLEGGPADLGDLRPGDVLVGINGTDLADGYDAMNRIAGTRPGTQVTLNVIRNREPVDVMVEVGTRPQPISR